MPTEEEKDPRFRAQIDRLSVIGLRIIAGVCIGNVIYFTLVGVFSSVVVVEQFGLVQPLTIGTLGLLALALSFWHRGRRHARAAGMVVGYGVAVVESVTVSSIVDRPEVGYFLFAGIVTGVMLVGITTLPLKPLQTFGLGAAIAATYGIAIPWLVPVLSGQSGGELVFVGQVVVLCTALTMVVYRQRVLALSGAPVGPGGSRRAQERAGTPARYRERPLAESFRRRIEPRAEYAARRTDECFGHVAPCLSEGRSRFGRALRGDTCRG